MLRPTGHGARSKMRSHFDEAASGDRLLTAIKSRSRQSALRQRSGFAAVVRTLATGKVPMRHAWCGPSRPGSSAREAWLSWASIRAE